MSVHLVGGGRAEHILRVYGPFAAEAMHRARAQGRSTARVGVVQLQEKDEAQENELFTQFADILAGLGHRDPVPILVRQGDVLAAGQLDGLDALLVSGGLTPAYLAAVMPVREEIRALVAGGAPYLGFSAGAAVAARRAIIGGWKVGDLAVCHEDNGEELDELTIVDGLGLVDFSVDVHAVQWGNLGRTITAVATGGVERAVALDESTVLVVDVSSEDQGNVPQGPGHGSQGPGHASTAVKGAGQAWWVEPADGGVTVRTVREPLSP